MLLQSIIYIAIFIIRKYGVKVEFIDAFLDKVDDETLTTYAVNITNYLENKISK